MFFSNFSPEINWNEQKSVSTSFWVRWSKCTTSEWPLLGSIAGLKVSIRRSNKKIKKLLLGSGGRKPLSCKSAATSVKLTQEILTKFILVGSLQSNWKFAGYKVSCGIQGQWGQQILDNAWLGHEPGYLRPLVFFPGKDQFLNLRKKQTRPMKLKKKHFFRDNKKTYFFFYPPYGKVISLISSRITWVGMVTLCYSEIWFLDWTGCLL